MKQTPKQTLLQRLFLLGIVLLLVWSSAGATLLLVAGSLLLFKSRRTSVTIPNKALLFQSNKLNLLCLSLLVGMPLLSSTQPSLHLLGSLGRYGVPVLLICGLRQIVRRRLINIQQLTQAAVLSGTLLSVVGLVSLFCPSGITLQALCLPDNIASSACLLDFGLSANARARSFAMNPNLLGGLLVMLIPLWFSLRNTLTKPLFYSAGGLYLATIMASGSRNALMGLFVICLLGCIGIRGEKRWQMGSAFVLLILLAVSAYLPRGLSLSQTTGRDIVFKTGLEMLQLHPLTGIGILSVEPVYRQMHSGWPRAAHLHNWLLQVMVESGVVAALLLFGLMGYGLYRGYNKHAAWTSLILLLCMSVADVFILDFRVLCVTCLCVGILAQAQETRT